MTKFQKSIITAFIITVIMTFTMPMQRIENFIFSGFSLGWSSDVEEKNSDNRVEILDDDTEIEFSFKIADLFARLFH